MKLRGSHRLSAKEKYAEKHPICRGASLTPAQAKIAQRVTTGNERFYVWNAGRQVGKSFTATQILLWFAINKPNTISMYVSMTYAQTSKLFKELHRGIRKARIIESCNKSEFTIEFKNGSQILFKSYQNVDSSRGYHISGILIVDEASWMQDGDFDQIYLPMLQNHKSAKALIISSPKGCNWFYNYYMRGSQGSRFLNKNYISFKTTYLDNPFCDKNDIESCRETMSDAIFRQEILAEFINGASSAFGDIYKSIIYGKMTQQRNADEHYYFGVDVGRQDDYSVVTAIEGVSGKVVDILRMRHMPFERMADEIAKMVAKYRPICVLQEVNGIGDPFYEMLEKKIEDLRIYTMGVLPLEAFTTTSTTKNNIVEALRIGMERKEIWLPDDESLKEELDVFEVSYSPRAHSVSYGARLGYHDDMVMSLCFANWAKRTHANVGMYGIC